MTPSNADWPMPAPRPWHDDAAGLDAAGQLAGHDRAGIVLDPAGLDRAGDRAGLDAAGKQLAGLDLELAALEHLAARIGRRLHESGMSEADRDQAIRLCMMALGQTIGTRTAEAGASVTDILHGLAVLHNAAMKAYVTLAARKDHGHAEPTP